MAKGLGIKLTVCLFCETYFQMLLEFPVKSSILLGQNTVGYLEAPGSNHISGILAESSHHGMKHAPSPSHKASTSTESAVARLLHLPTTNSQQLAFFPSIRLPTPSFGTMAKASFYARWNVCRGTQNKRAFRNVCHLPRLVARRHGRRRLVVVAITRKALGSLPQR